MKTYQIYKVKGNGELKPMGSYEASNGQSAINKMAERGNLSGNEWVMKFIAIPTGIHLRKLSPII